ncbi:hypothetical protein A2U01_0099935, partial [Trifolium medium]|nr:hypothetical protein [Trifolium medium]
SRTDIHGCKRPPPEHQQIQRWLPIPASVVMNYHHDSRPMRGYMSKSAANAATTKLVGDLEQGRWCGGQRPLIAPP